MPLIKSFETAECKVGIWEVTESKDNLISTLKPTEEEFNLITNMREGRAVEWLASRNLLHLISGFEKRLKIIKTVVGKPILANTDMEISISHTQGYVAAIISPYRVGIDIQGRTKKVEIVHRKFVGEQEYDLLSSFDREDILHILWGSKEAIFKAWGEGSVDFRKHLLLTSVEWNGYEGRAIGFFDNDTIRIQYDVTMVYENDYYLVYVYEKLRHIY